MILRASKKQPNPRMMISEMCSTNPNVMALDQQLNRYILEGRLLEAMDRFYDDDVAMQENALPPIVGKLANRQRLERFLEGLRCAPCTQLLATAVRGNDAFSEWIYEMVPRQGGRRMTTQVAVRRWAGERVVHERFYYSLG